MDYPESKIIHFKKRNQHSIKWYGKPLKTIKEFVPFSSVSLPIVSPKPIRPWAVVNMALLEKMAYE